METNVIDQKFDAAFYKFLARLEVYQLTAQQKKFVRLRERALEQSRRGNKPQFITDRSLTQWHQDLPDWLQDQRNQMTGPASNYSLCEKMLKSGSPGVMIDLEDSMANTGEILLEAHQNVKTALTTLKSDSVTFTRVRGLHMGQYIPSKFRTKHYVSASLFDLAYHFYDMNLDELRHPPCIYIPKSESMQEAQWWKMAFTAIEGAKGWKRGTIKCMALVEAHPLAYRIEEFSYHLQPYLVGLNLGRWDYMASLIDHNYHDPNWLFPDRNSVPTDVPFFQNLRNHMAQVCHDHGMLAIGGMTALYPNRRDAELNERALKALKADKENEAACLMDGAWTGHPDQNEIAVNAFPEPNQLDKLPGEEWWRTDLRSFPQRDKLPITEEGTREAIRTCIQYRQGVTEGRGASLINGYMEDLATDRIYRIMIAQRIDHGVHSEREVHGMFCQELERLGQEQFQAGADETFRLIQTRQFNPR